jgi:hypothetical protein
MLPLALRGPIKAAEMGSGGYRTSTGIPLPMEVTPWAMAVQSLGFTPSVKAEQSEVNFAFRQREGLLKQRQTVLTNQLYRAYERGEDPTSALQAAQAFSQAHPEMAIDVAAGLNARARARATAEMSVSGIAAAPRYLPTLEKYSFANTR